MLTPDGQMYAVFVTKGRGKNKMVMMDTSGTIYYDTDDRDQGLYVVDSNGVVTNVYVTPKGDVAMERLGNLNNVEQLQISDLGHVRLDRDRIIWAFVDETEPLVVNPRAFQHQNGQAENLVTPPARIDEGVIKVQEAKKQLFGNMLGRKRGDLGGILERERL